MASTLKFETGTLARKTVDGVLMTPEYLVVMVKPDGSEVGYHHGYYARNGRNHAPAKVARYFDKLHGWKGWRSDRLEITWQEALV
tara:strand:+ start:806 stop:1060 length:255 start_codon:yes stop_codon:yes gene_type:complete